MSGPATGEPGRGIETPKRTAGTRDAASAILIVLALGLALRLILTQALPGSGFEVDLNAFRAWAANLADEGPFGFYERDFFHDYTPGYLYILWGIGVLGRLLGDIGDLIKLPAIIADGVLGWLVWSMARELGAGRRAALLGGAIVVANPITWFDSVVWGQVDSVGVVFLLLALRELWRDRLERGAILAVVAAVIKPQLGILVPIVAAVTIRRALWPDGGYGHEARPGTPDGPWQGRTTRRWERRIRGPLRIATTGLAGLVTAVVLSAGFGLSIFDLVRQMASAAATYPYVSVNAYNPWALATLDGRGIAENGLWVCDVVIPPGPPGPAECPDAFMVGPVPAVVVGTVLLLAAVIAATLMVARRPDRRTMLVGLAVLALVFFVVPTRVHERYLYPFFAIAALLAAVSWRWRVAYVLLSLATFANMYVVLTTLYPGNPQIEDWLGIGPELRGSFWVTAAALTHLAGLMFAATQLRDRALERLGDEIDAPEPGEADGDFENDPDDELEPPGGHRAASRPPQAASAAPDEVVQPAYRSVPGRSAGRTASAASPARSRYRLPTWSERPGLGETGVREWLRARLTDAPVRADRSALLRREGGGRFTRLDLWILVVLVVAALGMRMWRLAEPYRMHFDEVYHARTATEFLQHWRYGLSHDIYEWTHPHLAKYAMAAGLVAFGGDEVVASGELGVPVLDAVLEPRWDDPGRPAARLGDRLLVATGDEIRAYDLRTRALEAAVAAPGATRLALDRSGHRLFAATDGGELAVLELAALDEARAGGADGGGAVALRPFGALGGPARVLHVSRDGTALLAALDDERLVALDAKTGSETGTLEIAGVTAIDDAGRAPVVVARPADVTDAAAVASELAALLGGVASQYESRLAEPGDRVLITGVEASGSARTSLDEAITGGRLPGVTVETVPRMAVGTAEGVSFVSPAEAGILQELRLEGGAFGLAYVEGIDKPKLYVTTSPADGPAYRVLNLDEALADVSAGQAWPLPGAGSTVRWNDANQELYILGEPPEGRPADEVATVYVVEPHANAVYADAALSFEPAALVLDANPLYPSSDRAEVLAVGDAGAIASVDAGSQNLAWRIPGVLAGVAMAALLYVLARILFERRAVAVLVAVLVVLDGMLFVQSRIGMNDAYVALFVVAAYTLFAALWTGRWRWRGAFWVTMPAIGVLLGLALASKWVAAYSIGALGILILARSALGRVVLLVGLILVTTVLGYLAMSVPPDTPASAGWQLPGGVVVQGNLTFTLIMIGLTLVAAVAMVVHPIAWSFDEVRFAVGAPAAAGAGLALVALATGRIDRSYTVGPIAATPLHAGFALMVASLVIYGLFVLAGKRGLGPLAVRGRTDEVARGLEPAAEPPEGWLRPGWALGLPVAWMTVCLLAVPVAVYVASYIPWAWVENHRIVEGWPEGATGQTLLELTGRMYAYHNELSSAHAASSPWWAWPLDLKPVWFYQQSYAAGTSGAVYDAGNQLIWWLGIPAMAFCAVQAWRRRSLALALIVIAFACQWIPWARIDRAAFQYHYYTSLPFVILALAYFLAELWHGASRRTWLVARLAAATAVVLPVVMWLFHRPLCGFVRVLDANESSQACPTLIPELLVTARSAAVGVVVVVAAIVLVRQILALDRAEPDHRWSDDDRGRFAGAFGGLAGVLVTAGAAAVLLVLAPLLFAEVPLITLRNVAVEPIAILVLVPLLGVALVVASARDARRFVAGTVAAIAAFFVVWYPNLAALPLPSHVVNTYQGFLPTYVYPFQFPVSTVDRGVAIPPLLAPAPAMLLVALTVTCLVVAWSAWVWRESRRDRAAGADPGDGRAPGSEAGPDPALGASSG